LALFAFIIGDFLNSGSTYFNQSQDQVALVNGSKIGYQEYQFRIDELSGIYEMQSNTSNLTDEQRTQIKQSVYDAMVHEIVFNAVLDKLGIKVTPEELFDMVQGENISPMVQQFPLFTDPETGVYSKMRALNVLKTIENYQNVPPQNRAEIEMIRNYWLFWERNMKQQRLQEKYMTLISKAIVANPLDAKDSFDSSLESSDIVYAMQSYITIPDSVINISDNEIRKIYNQRKEQFKQKESRIIDYISVDIKPSEDDYAKVQDDADKLFEELSVAENIGDIVNANSVVPFLDAFVSENGMDTDMLSFAETASIGEIAGPFFRDDSYRIYTLIDKTTAPDSVNVSHILLASQDANTEELESMADSLVAVLKTGGNFEALAAQYSVDQSGQTGGEIGWITEAAALRYFGEDFKNAIFSTPINQPTVIKAPYGIQITKVTERTANVPKYKIAYIHLSVSPGSKTYSNLYNALIQFVSINNSVEKLNAASTEAGYIVNSNVRLTADERFFGMIPDSRPIIRWAFESTKKDEISTIFECKDHFVVAIRKGALPEGYQSIQSVAPMLRNELAFELKGQEIVKELKSKNLNSVDDFANAMGAQVDSVRYINFATSRISTIGVEPKLTAKITFAPLHSISEPVIGRNGVYIFNVFNRSKAENEYDEQLEILKLESNNSYRIGYTSVMSLIEKATIKDNRIRFD
jgi:peptidyl-prolyl cis-trans isomerase D